METRRALQVDAFADEPFAGNAAGVVPNADDLTEAQMQAIATELAVSETAFFRSSDEADRRVRYFTPTTEVDLCGHATIASHAHLLEDGVIDPGTHSLETNVGVLDIEVDEDGTVWMTQDAPEIREVDLDYERVADALGIDHAALEDVGADFPLAVASTGLPFLVVPVNFLEHVSAMDPDHRKIEDLSDEVGATGIYAFSFDTLEADSTLHGRMFAPAAGVPEDPVTGTASGATGAYLREVEAFDGDFPNEMTFEQGHFVDRPGYVRVRVDEQVRVGGQAATALDGELRAPAVEDGDDIIEV
ncbi:PhzF family phenazine biosynthesis protein [Halorussus salinisoli]|uniref:PhzF family phenazine biosynthesis protein n=1 Tax=Halorussus salinisoli TaxID=2558242 RepID=UPI0010C1DAAA|nr:PhzF family phenazine biosynthesis protein [Halorussus salinisoli]